MGLWRWQEVLGADQSASWLRESREVEEALKIDNMQSIKDLVPDLLASLPVLFYQGVQVWGNT